MIKRVNQFVNRLCCSAVMLLCGLTVGALPARAVDVRGYGVFKAIDYVQTDTNAPALASGNAYSFSAIVQPAGNFSNQVVGANVESSLGFVDQLTAPPTNSDQPFATGFAAASQSALDGNYPTGVYTLRVTTAHDGNRVLTLNMPTNSFPTNAPRVANFSAAQSIDPSNTFVLSWDAFAGGTTNDFIGLSVADANGAIVFRSAAFGPEVGLTLLSGTNTSIVIPSNTLARGQTYFGYLYFEKDVVNQTTNYPGARELVGFAKATSFTLQTGTLAPRLESLGVTTGQFTLRLHGENDRGYVLQSVTNLSSTNWVAVVTNVATGGSFDYVHTLTTNSGARFFRALLVP